MATKPTNEIASLFIDNRLCQTAFFHVYQSGQMPAIELWHIFLGLFCLRLYAAAEPCKLIYTDVYN